MVRFGLKPDGGAWLREHKNDNMSTAVSVIVGGVWATALMCPSIFGLCATLRVFKNVLKDQTWLAALFLIWCITWSDTLAEPDVSVAAASSTSNTINVHNFKATTLADASMGDAVLLDFGDGCVGYGVFLRFNRERPQSRSRAR